MQDAGCVANDNIDRIHFTYKESPDMNTLCQGDILSITEPIRDILAEVHPYFLRDQYKYFMVLTQSCDLVRRNGKTCRTPYISLAAVRDFDTFFENYLVKNKWAKRVNDFILMESKNKDKAYQFLERLYNNTEPDYFFLFREPELSFPSSMIVTLKVSIAIKSELHYNTCLSAKVLELCDEFKAKLGWLVGNIYSRVGTIDWDSIMSASEKKTMLSNELSSHCIVGSQEQITELTHQIQSDSNSITSIRDAVDFLKSIPIDSKYKKTVSAIEGIISALESELPPGLKDKIIKRINSSSQLKALIPN